MTVQSLRDKSIGREEALFLLLTIGNKQVHNIPNSTKFFFSQITVTIFPGLSSFQHATKSGSSSEKGWNGAKKTPPHPTPPAPENTPSSHAYHHFQYIQTAAKKRPSTSSFKCRQALTLATDALSGTGVRKGGGGGGENRPRGRSIFRDTSQTEYHSRKNLFQLAHQVFHQHEGEKCKRNSPAFHNKVQMTLGAGGIRSMFCCTPAYTPSISYTLPSSQIHKHTPPLPPFGSLL